MNNNVEEEFESSTPLRHLAKLMGIGVKTIGSDGIEREVSDE